MEPVSTGLLILIFLLGTVCGALLITMERQIRLSRLKAQFAAELRAMTERSAGVGDAVSAPRQVAAAETASEGATMPTQPVEAEQVEDEPRLDLDPDDLDYPPILGPDRSRLRDRNRPGIKL